MRVGIVSVFTDYHRLGRHHRGAMQPQIGPLIAALLPEGVDIDVINDTWTDPDWDRRYDLLFVSCLHSDFDRAREIAHYWRQRGARTVIGGNFASAFPQLCAPYFDAVAVGEPETIVPRLWQDFRNGALRPLYEAEAYDPATTPTPRFDLAARQQALPISLEATRGCPHVCEFCVLTGTDAGHRARPTADVVRDVLAGRRLPNHPLAWHRRKYIIFYDNNIGGNKRRLRDYCAALKPLNIRWGGCVSFNILRDTKLLAEMAASGCRMLFVGLESFNPATLAAMGKKQNAPAQVRAAVRRCHDLGIVLMTGLILSPAMDDIAYIDSIPDRLDDCGLFVPTYVAFETPFPGTPQFRRLAGQPQPAFLPNALLRDFNGYTLVTRPAHASPEEFVAAYRRLVGRLFSPASRLAKLLRDAASFLSRGHLTPLLLDAAELASEDGRVDAARTLMAGSEIPPPECGAVPFAGEDFASAAERAAIVDPWRVTDGDGRVVPAWLTAARVPASAVALESAG
ncbi:MAG TPA: radical SAM protein [Rhodocyclaceae bacterium]|nr:radical SAM protein [Rhodocyclaceae bacterium]